MTRDLHLCRRLLGQARGYWPHVLTILLLGLCSAPLALLVPLPLKIAVDCVLGKEPLPPAIGALLPAAWAGSPAVLLSLAAALLVAIALVNQLVSSSASLLRAWTGQRMILDFRARLFRRTQRLSLAYHDSKGISDSLYRIQYDAVAIQNVTIEGVIPFTTSALTVVAMVYVTVRISWQLCLVALAISPVLILTSQFYRAKLRRRWRELKRSESQALSVVEEVLGAMRVVKAFCKEDQEEDRFLQRSRESLRTQLKVLLGEAALGLVVGLVTAAGTASVLYI